MHEIVRLLRSHRDGAMKLWPVDQTMSESPKGLFHNQWLFRLVLAGRKMDPEDVKLATQLVETLLSLRQREDEVIE